MSFPSPRSAAILELLAVLALLAAFTAMVSGEAVHQSVTVDEFHLVPQAAALRATGDLDLGYKTPPLLKRWIGVALPPGTASLPDPRVNGRSAAEGWEPWIFGTRFLLENRPSYDRIFLRARRMMLPVGWLVGMALWWWARSAVGRRAGIVALGLFTFSPEMISFGSLVSLDLAVTALVVGFLVLLREHLRGGSWWALLAASGVFGLGLGVKLSMATVAPLFVLPLASRRGPKTWMRKAGSLVAAALAALFALHASYGFDRPLPRWQELEPRSRTFRRAQTALPGEMPVPLPLRWLRALDGQAHDVEVADVPSYLNGVWSDRGWSHYYLAAYLYKWPLPLLALALLLLASGAASLRSPPEARRPDVLPRVMEIALVAVPIVLWGGSFSLAGGLDIGIRYVLPCTAVACAGLGMLAGSLPLRSATGAAAVGLAAITALVSAAAYPHHLSFVNEIAGGPRGAYRHLADSNLDWGQELKHLAAYARERGIERIGLGYFGHVAPELYGLDYFVPDGAPREGWYAISANFLAGYPYVVWDHGQFRPVRPERWEPFRALEPVDTLGGALMIYRIPAAAGR